MSLRERDLDVLVAGNGHRPADKVEGHPRRRRWLVLLTLAALLTGAGGVTALVLALDGKGSRGTKGPAAPPATAPVARQDLVARQEVDGTVGYAGTFQVVNHLQGTVTFVPDEGTVVERGQRLYSVDERPVPLLYGEVPAWRRLAEGVGDGVDVRQLEENLVAMGIVGENDLKVDDNWTSATTAAVRRWQKAIGVEQTGAVELGQAVFLPGAVRVADTRATKGSPAPVGAPIMNPTGTARVVLVDLDATKQSLVKAGDKVEVKLPDGQTTTGTVATVGTVAKSKGEGESAKTMVEVTVSLDDPQAAGRLDKAPVRVGITTDSRKGVLAVPVNALLALAEGGYAVEVADGGGRRLVPVRTGLFANALVEVSGDGLVEGTRVVVPR